EEGALERALLAALREGSGLDVGPEALVAHDLALHDTQPAALGGLGGELVQSARLDNLVSCHAALTALVAAPPGDPTLGVVLHDHEEVGSQSASGAGSLVLRAILERVARALPAAGRDPEARALATSFLVSADMAHAVHPAHADRHDAEHPPRLGAGPVIKVNASQSYATDAPGAAVFERACREALVPTQRFASRADQRCGSTIGPLSAARLGVRAVDVGNPMLSMHSCREVAATADVPRMIAALGAVLASAERTPPPAA
ncbi:MAG: M18 family aminopeptidase, partial [Deltaproteobacteria bacterium]|nr:M18 family aminopeptidase [Deltaproteobacteria bacterium]